MATLTNVNIAVADTEYTHALAAKTRKAVVQVVDQTSQPATSLAFRIAFVTDKVATPTQPYETIPAGAQWKSEAEAELGGATLYFAAASGGANIHAVIEEMP